MSSSMIATASSSSSLSSVGLICSIFNSPVENVEFSFCPFRNFARIGTGLAVSFKSSFCGGSSFFVLATFAAVPYLSVGRLRKVLVCINIICVNHVIPPHWRIKRDNLVSDLGGLTLYCSFVGPDHVNLTVCAKFVLIQF